MPPNTAYVGRGTKYGNPFKLVSVPGYGREIHSWNGKQWNFYETVTEPTPDIIAKLRVVELYKEWFNGHFCFREEEVIKPSIPPKRIVIRELAGKNLCCWCPVDEPCHADVLLELINQSAQ